MRRRRLLALLGAGIGGGLAGCSAPTTGESPAQAGQRSRSLRPPSLQEVDLPVPLSAMRQPLPRDYIPAIVDPAFASDWSSVEPGGSNLTLPGDAPVLGLERAGSARAYPLRVLNRHEVVNDDFGGPIAVTYCVLCGSGVAFVRRVEGGPTVFGVSGRLWRSDLVMYDRRTDSLWSQLLATAIRGPMTGTQLHLVPVRLTTWAAWQETHPETDVLLPPPASGTIPGYDRSFDYSKPKYGYGSESQIVGRDSFDGKLHPKTLVVGVRADGVTRAYPYPVVSDAGAVNDRVGDLPVVVATTPGGSLVAYDRRVNDETLRFAAADESHLSAGGSRWRRTTGRAVDGPYEGETLRRVNGQPPMFWYGWSKFFPETEVYGLEASTDR